MGKSSVYEGKTFDEAVRKGLEELRLQRAEAQITRIEEGRGGFLGIGARPFKVSVSRRPGGAVREPEETREHRVGGRRDERRSRGGRDGGGRDGGGRDRKRDDRKDEGKGDRKDEGKGERRPQPVQAQGGARAEGGGRAEGGARPESGGRAEGRGEGRRGEGRRDGRKREERRPGRRDERPAPVPPVELARPPVVDEDEFDDLSPAAAVAGAGAGAESEESGDARRRRRRGRRGGRGRRRGGPEEESNEGASEATDRVAAVASIDGGANASRPAARAPEPERAPEPVRAAEPARAFEPARTREPMRAPEPMRAAEPVRAADTSSAEDHDYEESDMGANELSELSKQVTSDLLKAMGFEATVTVVAEGNRADVTVEVDDDDELLTGEKGETRQALQHLLNRFINRGEGSRYHLQLEINDFWQRREVELEALARSLADEAVATHAEVRTGYLSSQERRIVHVTLKTDSRVKTDSVGEDVKRFVVIAPVGSAERTEEHAG